MLKNYRLMIEKYKYLDRKIFIQSREIIDLKYKTKDLLLVFFFSSNIRVDHPKILLNLVGPESHGFTQDVKSAVWHLSFLLDILFVIHVDSSIPQQLHRETCVHPK